MEQIFELEDIAVLVFMQASSTMYASMTVPYPPMKCRLCTTWDSNC